MTVAPPATPESADFQRRYRRSAAALALAVLLLAATALWLVFQDRAQVWATAHRNQEDVAIAMQTSITELLAQPIFSIQNIATDLGERQHPSREVQLQALRTAMRYDPLSTYLGIRTESGLLLVDAAGEAPADPALAMEKPAGGLRLG
ncbi:hypothetical protein, partial [Pelomonas sp. KK5]|uniref:hypothetical protein n=1 Tax=Pelomonas sp. KK5 TaxID=1855730 RepID=UPI0011804B4D